MYKVEINVKGIVIMQKKAFVDKLKKFAITVKDKIDEKTPEDKMELIGNTQISEPAEVGNKVSIRIFNDTEYVRPVEYGVEGKEFNYQKPKGTHFFTGVGAGMFGRTFHEIKNNFNILKK